MLVIKPTKFLGTLFVEHRIEFSVPARFEGVVAAAQMSAVDEYIGNGSLSTGQIGQSGLDRDPVGAEDVQLHVRHTLRRILVPGRKKNRNYV